MCQKFLFWLIDMGKCCKVNPESAELWNHPDLEPSASSVTSGRGHTSLNVCLTQN